jgi:hypothetical protein
MVYHNWSTARRTESKDNGLVFTSRVVKPNEILQIKLVEVSDKLPGLVSIGFTSRPVKPNETFQMKLVEVSDKLPGVVSIGFTSHDPSTLVHNLPKNPNREWKRKPGFWTCSLSKRHCVKNRILFFYVTTSGTIHYGVDGVEIGKFDKDVDTSGRLWGLVDIWTPPTTIQIVSSKLQPEQNLQYTFTSKPLHLDEQVLVKTLTGGGLVLGVTSCQPALLCREALQTNPDSLMDRPEYWVVINDPTWNFDEGDELSMIVNESGELKIWKNASLLLKRMHVDHTLELWGFFAVDNAHKIEVRSRSLRVPGRPAPSAPKAEGFEASECVVCCDNAIDTALYPCGHLSMCNKCAKEQWRGGGVGHCPICRTAIKDVLKIYKS